MRPITLTTDFGTTDPFVGIMKGVIAGRAPGVTVIDLSHGIPPQDVFAGALCLLQAAPWFPSGTVHLAVVDPGVGGPRRGLCVETDTALFVGPDNGVLSLAAPRTRVQRIVTLDNERFLRAPRSPTFHGRDVFAPVAAALAMGTPPDALGPTVDSMVTLEIPPIVREVGAMRGTVIHVDGFGNLATNLPGEQLSAPAAPVIEVAGRRVEGLVRSYHEGAPGRLIAVVNSWGFLELAVREGSAAALIGAGRGTPVVVTWAGR